MKKLYVIANWKSYKTTHEATSWLLDAKKILEQRTLPKEKIVVLCVPFTLLSLVANFVKEENLPIAVGSENVSPFDMGAYTGEINAKQLTEFVTYSLIGHSERRRYLNETDEMLAQKVERSLAENITPILCVTQESTPIPQSVAIVGYEPVGAIGSGQPDTPENANAVATAIKKQNARVEHVLYGGSVIAENVSLFTSQSNIDGVIVGGASLDAKKLLNIAYNA